MLLELPAWSLQYQALSVLHLQLCMFNMPQISRGLKYLKKYVLSIFIHMIFLVLKFFLGKVESQVLTKHPKEQFYSYNLIVLVQLDLSHLNHNAIGRERNNFDL